MALSRTKKRAQEYSPPYIVPLQSANHWQSFVILHGRGREGENFGAGLLSAPISDFKSLQDAFPNAKFVFPTASKWRSTDINRTGITQWFDLRDVKEQERDEELQFEGLRESSQYVHQLLQQEIAAVGSDNVVIWGMSQGMAIVMIALLLWIGPKIAAAIGMCGWIPLKARMERDSRDDEAVKRQENLFGDDEEETTQASNLQKAVRYLREELDLPPSEEDFTALLGTPIFIGHGTDDPKVPPTLSKQAYELLRLLKVDIEHQMYEGLEHWYSPEVLHDIIDFLHRKTVV